MSIRKTGLIMIAGILTATMVFAATIKVPNTNISINSPKGWTADTSPRGGALFILYSEPLQGFKSMISLSKDPLSGKTAGAWMAEYKAGLAKNIGDIKIVKEGEKKLGGAPYTVIEFRGMQGEVMLHWLQAIHFQEGYAWIFSGVTRERHTDIYMKRFQRAFSSIYFPPPPPENLVAQVVGETEVTLAWTTHPLAVNGYEIQRRDAQFGVWETVATLSAGISSHTDATLECGTEVRYRIKCLNPKGDSNWSSEASATMGVCPVITAEEPIEIK